MRGCCSPCSQLAQQLEETNTRAVQAYNLAARAFAAVIPPTGGSNIDVSLVAGPAYEIALKNPMDEDVVINADLTVNGDIYQNGSAYESHAEQLYTTKDTVIMRDGATTGLSPGDVAGLIMKLYDGVNDGALVVSNDGTARVGDVGSEQPLMTRDESADMTDGALIKWNATQSKAVNEGTVGSNTKPIMTVNGVATAVTNDLVSCGNVNQTIIGDKTINHLFFKRPSDNNKGYGYIENQYTTNINQTIIEVNNDDSSSRGRLYLRFNKTNNTVTLELQKNLNGTVTWSTIATL